jgi:hypothetical protein
LVFLQAFSYEALPFYRKNKLTIENSLSILAT